MQTQLFKQEKPRVFSPLLEGKMFLFTLDKVIVGMLQGESKV